MQLQRRESDDNSKNSPINSENETQSQRETKFELMILYLQIYARIIRASETTFAFVWEVEDLSC